MKMQEEIINNVAVKQGFKSYDEYAEHVGKHDVEWDNAIISETIEYIVKNIKQK